MSDEASPVHVEAPRNRSAIVAVFTSLCMAVAKLVVGASSGSVSVIASGLDSLLDVVASGVNAWAIAAAEAPPDDEHGFGHGKFESIAALFQAAFVGGSAVLVSLEAAQRFANQTPIHQGGMALWTIGISTLVTVALVTYQKYEVRRTGSLAVAADRAHYTSDIASGIGVMAAVYLSTEYKMWWVDPLVSLGVAGMLLYTGFSLARRALTQLLDHALPPEEIAQIHAVLDNLGTDVLGHHGLRTRGDGLSRFIEVHLELPGDLTLHRANEIYTAGINALRDALPDCDVSIHLDPAGEPDPIPRSGPRLGGPTLPP